MDIRGLSQFSGTAQSCKSLRDLCLPVGRRGMLPDPSCGPLILILPQSLAMGRWWALTSMVQRHKNWMYVVCKSALNYPGDNPGPGSQGRQEWPRRNGLLKVWGTHCQVVRRKATLIDALRQQLVWLLTSLILANTECYHIEDFLQLAKQTKKKKKGKKHLLALLVCISLIACEIENVTHLMNICNFDIGNHVVYSFISPIFT